MNYTKNITVNENYDFIVCDGGTASATLEFIVDNVNTN